MSDLWHHAFLELCCLEKCDSFCIGCQIQNANFCSIGAKADSKVGLCKIFKIQFSRFWSFCKFDMNLNFPVAYLPSVCANMVLGTE